MLQVATAVTYALWQTISLFLSYVKHLSVVLTAGHLAAAIEALGGLHCDMKAYDRHEERDVINSSSRRPSLSFGYAA